MQVSYLAIHDIITGLQAAGQTILLITHDMAEADALAYRVAIIDHVRLLALDTPAGLKRSVRGGTVVTVTADGTGPAQLAAALAAGVPGARDARPLGDAVMLTVLIEKEAGSPPWRKPWSEPAGRQPLTSAPPTFSRPSTKAGPHVDRR